MALREEFVRTGNFLFRWRSYLPLIGFVILLIALKDYEYPRHSRLLDEIWDLSCLLISFFGLGIRALTLGYVPRGTSGRNTKDQVADSLNATGMYSIVRHPLYLGNAFICLGISLSVRSWWAFILTMMMFWLYYERIMFAEEEFLRGKFGETYLNWAEGTPAFVPRFRNWRSPNMPFSFRSVLRREYAGFFGIIASFVALEIVEHRVVRGTFGLGLIWIVIFTMGLAAYMTVRILEKETRILDVEGR